MSLRFSTAEPTHTRGAAIPQRVGDYIQTFRGIRFYPLDPRPDEIEIEDIAHALAHQCRFSGHTSVAYSVAEHCVHAAVAAPSGHALAALLHDASEAYLVDLPTPLKRDPVLGKAYRAIEAPLQAMINARFGLPRDAHERAEVADVDRGMLATEVAQLMKGPRSVFGLDRVSPYKFMLPCWEPAFAKARFLYLFHELVDDAL